MSTLYKIENDEVRNQVARVETLSSQLIEALEYLGKMTKYSSASEVNLYPYDLNRELHLLLARSNQIVRHNQ